MIPEALSRLEVGRKLLIFSAASGTVIESKVWSETEVRSHGGGGYSSNYIHAPTITSTVSTNREIWVRTEQGEEFRVVTYGSNPAVKAGHAVSVICVDIGSKFFSIALINKTTKLWYQLCNLDDFARKHLISFFWGAFIILLMTTMAYALFNVLKVVSVSFANLAFYSCYIFGLYYLYKHSSSRRNSFKKRITSIVAALS